LPGGTLVWSLTGEPGYRYLIEKAGQDTIWRPYVTVTNISGTINFTDSSTNLSPVFYRGRILD